MRPFRPVRRPSGEGTPESGIRVVADVVLRPHDPQPNASFPTSVFLTSLMPHPDDAFWTSTFIESNGLRLHVLRTPVPNRAGRPAIVLAHGVTDNARCFTTFAERLAPTFDV